MSLPREGANGSASTGSDGGTTRSSARPTGSTARAPAPGRSTSRTASSPGRRSRPTTRRTGPRSRVRAAQLPAGRLVQLVPILADPRALPVRPRRPARALPRGPERHGGDSVEAWAAIVEDPEEAREYKSPRGKGGFVRASWDDAVELVSAAHVYTIKRYGPDRIAGFSPIPAMSMVSYAAGTRFLSLIGGIA